MIGLIYEWEQTADFITVNVQLPVGISGKLAEIKIGENILNVSLPGNYLLRIYLFGLVIRDSSKVIIKPGNITVNLKKKCDENWSQLEHEDNKNKRILTEKYQELLKNEEIELEEKAKQLRIDKREQKDKSVGSQLTKEQNKRELREQFKENEKLKLSKEIERKKEAELEAKKKSEDAQKKAESKNISFSDSVPSYRKPPGQVMTGDAPIRKSKMAPPRNRGKIQIKFTERAFPTPVRESKRPEEEEWLQKQAKARKAAEDFENDLEPHEKEVGYLEDKGIKMMKNGDVEGALNAFNIAIKLFPSNPMLFMHRAAANLKFGNAIRAAQDAARGLEMFTPPVPQNLPQRIQCHLLRGRSLRKLEMMTEALMDFNEACKLDPKDKSIEAEADKIRAYIESNGDGWQEKWETDLLA